MSRADYRRAAAGDAFWRFSLALYARPGVAEALLRLQDRAGHDVNLILFGLWVGATRGQAIETADLTSAELGAAPIRDIVSKTRTLRRDLGAASEADLRALRRRVLALELAAERQVQHRLAVQCPAPDATRAAGDRIAAAQANLALCLGGDAGSAESDVIRAAFASLIRRA